MIWRLRAEQTGKLTEPQIEQIEQRARKLVAASLFLLAAYVVIDATHSLKPSNATDVPITAASPVPGAPGVEDAAELLESESVSALVVEQESRDMVKNEANAHRLTRWLYHGLHSFDLPGLYERRALWRARPGSGGPSPVGSREPYGRDAVLSAARVTASTLTPASVTAPGRDALTISRRSNVQPR